MQPQTPVPKKAGLAVWIATLFIGLSLYSYGTAMMDYFLLYPSRGLVGEAEFPAYHQALEKHIIPVSVVPFFIITVLNILLCWLRPAFIPKSMVLVSLFLLLTDWLSTALVQIPLNLKLHQQKDEQILAYVMETNWLRVFLESAQALIVFGLLLKVFKTKMVDSHAPLPHYL